MSIQAGLWRWLDKSFFAILPASYSSSLSMEVVGGTMPRWFQRWWGKVVIVVGVLFGILLLAVMVLTGYYWWQLKQGKTPAFLAEQYGHFTRSSVGNVSGGAGARSALEQGDDPFLGRPNAPVVIVEFVDYKCPNCAVAAPILKRVNERYGNSVKIIIRDFPAESIHPGATQLSELAFCALRQNHFWALHDLLFSEQDSIPAALSDSDIKIIADQAGLEYHQLTVCLQEETTRQEVRQDYIDGASYGVAGTPTFFINGRKVEGVVPFETWQSYLDTLVVKK